MIQTWERPSPVIMTVLNFFRYALLCINVAFVLLGICLLMAGGIIKGMATEYDVFLEDTKFLSTDTAGTMSLIVGSIIFCIAIIGCCSTLQMDSLTLMLYSILMLFLIALQFTIIIMVTMYSGRLDSFLNETMVRYMKEYVKKPPMPMARRAWDELQGTFKCCGVENATDWIGVILASNRSREIAPHELDTIILPGSCCGQAKAQNCTIGVVRSRESAEGCFKVFKEFAQRNFTTLYTVGIAILILELACLVFALTVFIHRRRLK